MTVSDCTVTPVEAGPVDTVGYLIADAYTGEALIVDTPLGSSGAFRAHVAERGLRVAAIVLTHGHFDHVGDAAAISEAMDVPIWIHRDDDALLRNPMASFSGLPFIVRGAEPGRLLVDGERLRLGSHEVTVIHTPGHTRGGICLHVPDRNMLFTGDTLFRGSIGRTDLPGGDYDTLLNAISTKLLTLPPETAAYPGHGPATSLGFESEHNPFIREYLDHF